jgi:hypothetical protein
MATRSSRRSRRSSFGPTPKERLEVALRDHFSATRISQVGEVVGITKEGYGRARVYPSRTEARSRPAVDLILETGEDVVDAYPPPDELSALMAVCGRSDLADEVRRRVAELPTARRRALAVRPLETEVWHAVLTAAQQEKSMAAVAEGTAPTQKTRKATARDARDPGQAGRPSKWPDEAKITLLKNEEGRTYGGDLNPKRAGSLAADRFTHYRTGMTVAEYRKVAGSNALADLAWDTEHKFISVG